MSESNPHSEVIAHRPQIQNLFDKDFSNQDIRGKDFSNVAIQSASFRKVKAGLSPMYQIGLHVLVVFLSMMVGIIAAYTGTLSAMSIFANHIDNLVYTLLLLILFSFVFAIVLWRGIDAVLATGTVVIASIAIVAMSFIANEKGEIAVSVFFALYFLAGSISAVFNFSLSTAIAKMLASQKAFFLSLFFGVLGVIYGSILGVGSKSSDWAYPVSIAFGLVALALGTYVGQQAMRGNPKYLLIRTITLALYAKGGTSFRGADLTDADFTGASLEGADFRGAILTRTCWSQAKNLDLALTEGTYLANPYIRQLVVKKDTSNLPVFDYMNLREVNLADANLQGASFIGTDLSQATLANADLTGAILATAQLYQTDLSAATLTGANIQDWGISTETKLGGVHCDHIFMRLPTDADPDVCRKPDNKKESFKPGDFADFISPIVKTLELYKEQYVDMRKVSETFKTLDLFHHGVVDPSATAVALQQLAERYPEAGLEVIFLEGQGNEKIHVQARVRGNVDRSKMSADFPEIIEQVELLPLSEVENSLGALVDNKLGQYYQKLLEKLVEQPNYYMVQNNYDNSKGSQMKVEDGTAYVGGSIHINDENK
jgi:uncharacterized protein YjbI with pentapeptide repeats